MLDIRYWYTKILSMALCNMKSWSLMKQSVKVGMYFSYKENVNMK